MNALSLGRIGASIALVLSAAGCNEPPSPSKTDAPKPTSAVTAAVTSTTASTAAPSSSAATPDRIAAQHVLVAYKGAKGAKDVKRSKAEAKTLAEEVQKKAAAGTDFAELAKQYSDDEASRERLGSVGTFDRTSKVKPFADAAFALPVDGVSAVVESQFGFHVIKRNQ